jgi:hypothetical protein
MTGLRSMPVAISLMHSSVRRTGDGDGRTAGGVLRPRFTMGVGERVDWRTGGRPCQIQRDAVLCCLPPELIELRFLLFDLFLSRRRACPAPRPPPLNCPSQARFVLLYMFLSSAQGCAEIYVVGSLLNPCS